MYYASKVLVLPPLLAGEVNCTVRPQHPAAQPVKPGALEPDVKGPEASCSVVLLRGGYWAKQL